MSQLFLCEKPSQAQDIARVLSGGKARRMDGYLQAGTINVTWCIGHLLEMAMPEDYDESLKRWRLESLPILPDDWKMAVQSKVIKQFKAIKSLLASASEVVIATDADREGEVIAREVLDFCAYRGSLQRLWLSSLDDASIRKALGALRDQSSTEALYYAGLGRARSDWLVGMNLTRAYTCLGRDAGFDGVLSVGRVQTPTLALVVQRDLLIENFTPSDYYVVIAALDHSGERFSATWVPNADELATICDDQRRCTSQKSAMQVAQNLANSTAVVTSFDRRNKSKSAPLLFSLSALQKAASSRWGYGAEQTLKIAQALYEGYKATSYPRSDCQYLPLEQLDEASDVRDALMTVHRSDKALTSHIERMDMSLKSRAWNNAKITAHHGIIPTTNDRVDVASMSEPERNIYDLIVRHYLVQFYPPYIAEYTEIKLSANGVDLLAKGIRPVSSGWKSVLTVDKKEDAPEQHLPTMQSGDQAQVEDASVESKKTKPPARFTEGTLIDAMANVARYVEDAQAKAILKENEGIGTEATRAGIIETLKSRKYVQPKGKQLISTTTGRELIQMLPKELTDPVMTALMERLLSKIADGDLDLDNYMRRQTQYVTRLIESAKANAGQIQITPGKKKVKAVPVKTDKVCPDCGKQLLKRKGKKGYFLGCSGFPDCRHIEFLN